ncbi:hypothetical protein SSS_02515 [Sarcoptes scabiei]|uniref:Uncharacterized protein n=1 Tax=Sarcoptes scabiei TaxID=52283 RepID=A0A131ZW40_SARSC|nr:hypothetical protein SSS_02515 [Sarcoptes scabiei]KPM02749.1 hypothetical protein QR98_0011680 [Sarcoptes scabiei]
MSFSDSTMIPQCTIKVALILSAFVSVLNCQPPSAHESITNCQCSLIQKSRSGMIDVIGKLRNELLIITKNGQFYEIPFNDDPYHHQHQINLIRYHSRSISTIMPVMDAIVSKHYDRIKQKFLMDWCGESLMIFLLDPHNLELPMTESLPKSLAYNLQTHLVKNNPMPFDYASNSVILSNFGYFDANELNRTFIWKVSRSEEKYLQFSLLSIDDCDQMERTFRDLASFAICFEDEANKSIRSGSVEDCSKEKLLDLKVQNGFATKKWIYLLQKNTIYYFRKRVFSNGTIEQLYHRPLNEFIQCPELKVILNETSDQSKNHHHQDYDTLDDGNTTKSPETNFHPHHHQIRNGHRRYDEDHLMNSYSWLLIVLIIIKITLLVSCAWISLQIRRNHRVLSGLNPLTVSRSDQGSKSLRSEPAKKNTIKLN